MTMMNGFDARDIDILDEEYFGPPPRFLVENRSGGYGDDAGESRFADEESGLPSLSRIKQLLGVC
jgi:hypothetical protein